MTLVEIDLKKMRGIWRQNSVPVAFRSGIKKDPLKVKLPYSAGNRSWLQNGRRTRPNWRKGNGWWELPKSWFNDFVNRAMDSYGAVYVIQPYREQEKCAPACLNATGHECECSCMGANHGMGNNGTWFEVSETFATRWSDQLLACRLMKRKGSEETTS